MSAQQDHLLPANATPIEQELARQSTLIDRIDPGVIATVWDAWRCPPAQLAWLAWAMSVDHWDDDWPEVTKRQAIADSPAYHRRKGTIDAVASVVALLGRPFEITEWFDQVPEGRRGTANVQIESSPAEAALVLAQVRPLVMAAKPKSRAIYVGAGEIGRGQLRVAAGLVEETMTMILPFAYAGEDRAGSVVLAAGLLDETLTIVSPVP